MILISHRGNINGPNASRENSPEYIDEALGLGYDVEVDVWVGELSTVWLGHNTPEHPISFKWLSDRRQNLWIHCKNLEALITFNEILTDSLHYFWHEEDVVTLTSKGYIWTHVTTPAVSNSIAVLPEISKVDLTRCLGVCSDYIENYW